jgi:adenylate cyclase
MAIGMPSFYVPNLEAAHDHFEHGIALYDKQQHSFLAAIYGQDPGVTLLSYSAWTLWMRGYPDQALRRAREARSLAQDIAHPYSLSFSLMFGAWIHVLRQEPFAAQEWATAAMQTAAEHGFPYLVTAAKLSYGWARAAQGNAEEGILNMREALDRHQERDEELGRPYDLALLAQVHQQCGNFTQALALLEEACAVIERTGEHVYEAELYRLRGEFMLEAGDWKLETGLPFPQASRLQPLVSGRAEREAEESLLKAIAIAQQQQSKSLELRAVISLVRLRRQQASGKEAGNEVAGKREGQEAGRLDTRPSLPAFQHSSARLADAHQMLSRIYNWFIEGFDTPDLQEAKVLLATLEDNRLNETREHR